MIQKCDAPFPPNIQGRWLVSAQWASDAETPEAAAAEVWDSMSGGPEPGEPVILSVVNLDVGYRWTFQAS